MLIDDFQKSFDRKSIQDDLKQAEEERLEIVKRFPLNDFAHMTLERYAYGLEDSQNSFSWALENGTKKLALLANHGSQAFKIYFRKRENRWWYEGDFENEQKAWESIRQIYLHAFAFAKAKRWNEIDQLHTSRHGPNALLKALICYFPNDFLPVTSTSHIKHFLISLGVVDFDARAQNIVNLNKLLLFKLKRHPVLEDWTTGELARLLYAWSPPSVQEEEDIEEAPTDIDDATYQKIAQALEHKGQVILFGPPGTGKTFTAENFARRFLKEQPAAAAESPISMQSWLVVSNYQNRSWDALFSEGKVVFRDGKLKANFKAAQTGDLVFGYTSAPTLKIEAIARISRPMFMDEDNIHCIELDPVMRIKSGVSFEDFQKNKILKKSECMQSNMRGTMFKLTATEADTLRALSLKKEPALAEVLQNNFARPGGKITRLTFHPSYSYEDFIEGFRPDPTISSNLVLRLKDGIFKRICKEADANRSQRYLILIDEINRANVAKVFGEVITIIEKDKRGLSVELPQSNSELCVPPNVFVLATMNTSDRSIKLFDIALRRRFSFIEMQPNPDLLTASRLKEIDLANLLRHLNKSLIKSGHRDKQIGHSFFMEDGQPIHNIQSFARQFRQDVLPLLQEYCYDRNSDLANFVGRELVDIENDCLREDKIADDTKLASSLAKFIATSAHHDA
jgi:MoxR-like ATPase/predicted RNA-binding protein with PUA-like domain